MTICLDGSNTVYWERKLHLDEKVINDINNIVAGEVVGTDFPLPVTADMIADAFSAINSNDNKALGVFHMTDIMGFPREEGIAWYIVDVINEYMFNECVPKIVDQDDFDCDYPFIAKEN